MGKELASELADSPPSWGLQLRTFAFDIDFGCGQVQVLVPLWKDALHKA